MKIYKGSGNIGAERIDVSIDVNTVLRQTITGDDYIESVFTTTTFVEIFIGDYVLLGTKKYSILKEPSINKIKTNAFKYSIKFESDQYRFLSILYLFNNEAEFYLLNDLKGFAELLVNNLNRIFGENYFSLGNFPATEIKNINFNNNNCFEVLQKIANEFEVEYQISDDGKVISYVEKITNDTGLVFQFKQGLRNINRLKVQERNLITRLYAFGSTRNITSEYGSKRLKIRPLENNTEIFGTHEATKNFEDVYPRKNGTVTTATAINKFIDTSMDFDLRGQLIPGVTAKCTFNTGDLAGYEFEIASYNHTTKEFDLIIFKDDAGLILPNDVRKVKIGDKYVLHDIKMPEVYISNAENELLEKATNFLNQNSLPSVIYEIKPDVSYFRKNLVNLKVGDVIKVLDTNFRIDVETRVISIQKPIINPYDITIKVGDKLTIGYIQRVLSDQLELSNQINIERRDRTNQYNQIRRRYINAEELRDAIFDNDGYFNSDKIKPLSVETSMLTVGAKGDQFLIRDLIVNPNYNSNPNVTVFGDGVLVHFSIDSAGVKEWNITGSTKVHTDSNQYYYIYCRCVRGGNTADWLVSSIRYNIDVGSTYWYFLVGIVHSVQENVRAISLTYGQTTINGKFITTGVIRSSDGWNFIDLDNNKIVFGDKNSYLDWNNRNAGKLTISNAIIDGSTITNFIWADEANIGNWRIKDGKIVSEQEYDGLPITELDGKKGKITMRNSFQTYNQYGYTQTGDRTLTLDAENASIEARHDAIISQNISSGVAKLDSKGVFANFAGQDALPASSGSELKAAVVGLGFGNLKKSAFGSTAVIAGVFGKSYNKNSDPAPSYGGYFFELMARGLYLGIKTIKHSYYIKSYDVWISCYNTSHANVHLPSNPKKGRIVFVKRINASVRVKGNGHQLLRFSPFDEMGITDGECWMLVFDGSYWCAQLLLT